MEIFAIPLIAILGLPIGLLRLFTPFGILYALPVFVLIVAAILMYRAKNVKATVALAYAAAIGTWLSLISWIASRVGIAPTEATRIWALDLPSIAVAGFPIRALEIPPSPMGSDTIPLDMWNNVFANHLIWMAIGIIIAVLIVVAKKKFPTRFPLAPFVIALAGILYSLTLFVMWFD